MDTLRRFRVIRDLFEVDKESKILLIDLLKFQQELLKYNVKALVGLRQDTGYFTAETFIFNYEKSVAGKPHFDRIFSPFGFATYEEALKKSIEQGFDNFNISRPKVG